MWLNRKPKCRPDRNSHSNEKANFTAPQKLDEFKFGPSFPSTRKIIPAFKKAQRGGGEVYKVGSGRFMGRGVNYPVRLWPSLSRFGNVNLSTPIWFACRMWRISDRLWTNLPRRCYRPARKSIGRMQITKWIVYI